jgi:hypothetical protein
MLLLTLVVAQCLPLRTCQQGAAPSVLPCLPSGFLIPTMPARLLAFCAPTHLPHVCPVGLCPSLPACLPPCLVLPAARWC